MKSYFYGLILLFAIIDAPCKASDAPMDETKIVRSSVSIKCYAEADAAGVQGRARQKVMIDCFRQHRVLNPQKELSKRCLSKAEGKKGDEWKQSMLTCIAPIVTVEGE